MGSVFEYLDSGVITVLSDAPHTGEMPRVTVCASSAVRCSCEAFYDDEVGVGAREVFVLGWVR